MKILHTQETLQKSSDFSSPPDYKLQNPRKKLVKTRKRKSTDQLHLLSQEFKNSLDWDKETMNFLSIKTGLTEAQIYKWSWDQKKKRQNQDKLRSQSNVHLGEIFNRLQEIPILKGFRAGQSCSDDHELGCCEVINFRSIDYEMYCIQKQYRGGMENLGGSRGVGQRFNSFLEVIEFK